MIILLSVKNCISEIVQAKRKKELFMNLELTSVLLIMNVNNYIDDIIIFEHYSINSACFVDFETTRLAKYGNIQILFIYSMLFIEIN